MGLRGSGGKPMFVGQFAVCTDKIVVECEGKAFVGLRIPGSVLSTRVKHGMGPKVVYEFGSFRVDPEKGVLLRDDKPVSITPKTFETLLILVRHSREVVSKDDLMKELWPDAFVEEANLSQNIFMLRKALGDTPEDRRYIVTLPGKGYRFLAEVRAVAQDGEDVIIASRSRSQLVLEQSDSAPAESLPTLPASTDRRFRWRYLVAIVAVAGLLTSERFSYFAS